MEDYSEFSLNNTVRRILSTFFGGFVFAYVSVTCLAFLFLEQGLDWIGSFVSAAVLLCFYPLVRDYEINIKEGFQKPKIKGKEMLFWLWCEIFVVSCVYLIILIGIFSQLGLNVFEELPFTLPKLAIFDVKGLLTFTITSCILRPICEEILVRKIVLDLLKEHGAMLVIVFTSILFAISHGKLENIPLYFITSIPSAVMTLRSQSIIPAILSHFTYNFLLGLLIYDVFNFVSLFALALGIVLFTFIGMLILWKKGYFKQLKIKDAVPTPKENWKIVFTWQRIAGLLLFPTIMTLLT